MDNKAEEKKEILEMLAGKEISKEEAERKLSELGDPGEVEPVVEHQPAPPKKSNTGCLIAIIIAVVLLPVLLVVLGALFLLLFKVSGPVEAYRIPEPPSKVIEYNSSSSDEKVPVRINPDSGSK